MVLNIEQNNITSCTIKKTTTDWNFCMVLSTSPSINPPEHMSNDWMTLSVPGQFNNRTHKTHHLTRVRSSPGTCASRRMNSIGIPSGSRMDATAISELPMTCFAGGPATSNWPPLRLARCCR